MPAYFYTKEQSNGLQLCYSSLDHSLIGIPEYARTICHDYGILPQRRLPKHDVASIGWSEPQQKWFGWSHRAICGFGIGSTVSKGDIAYVAPTPEELIDDYANFFADISPESAEQHRAECQILSDRSGIRILHAPLMVQVAPSFAEAIESIESGKKFPEQNIAPDYTIKLCGRGEWTAQTLEEAKEMACVFAENVA